MNGRQWNEGPIGYRNNRVRVQFQCYNTSIILHDIRGIQQYNRKSPYINRHDGHGNLERRMMFLHDTPKAARRSQRSRSPFIGTITVRSRQREHRLDPFKHSIWTQANSATPSDTSNSVLVGALRSAYDGRQRHGSHAAALREPKSQNYSRSDQSLVDQDQIVLRRPDNARSSPIHIACRAGSCACFGGRPRS